METAFLANYTVFVSLAQIGLRFFEAVCVDPRHVELRNYVISRQIVIERRVNVG